MGAHPVVHFEIGAHDVDAQAGFYSELFGWDTATFDPGYRTIEAPDGVGIGGGIMALSDDMPNYVTVYVQTDELEATLATAVALGGRELVPPTPIPQVGRFALFADPEGQTIGLIEPTGDRPG